MLQSRGGGGGGAAQLISVDLMGAVPPEAAGRAPAFNQGAVFLRIGLPEAFGPTRHFPLRLAMDIGLAVRAFRPELWRGFTLDSGHGYVEFLSWDNAVPPMFPGFQTPTWNNFGGGRQSGPPR
ncbi:hypothetical protein [Stackebrandtia nassauensis]|uniref:hypothetical protein n=1 Tax=Stackebrandtia nassauensis TaxID=283811 RepID=UPI0011864EFD|nr:hypothetical protein [Stackebrandtia nassauensis]